MKINNNDHPLIGESVMVEPFLTKDPEGKRGHFGTIVYVDEDRDSITVQFEDHSTGRYQQDALIMLYPIESLKHILHATRGNFNHTELAFLERVYKDALAGKAEKALSRAVYGPYPSEKICTLNCRDFIRMWHEVKEVQERNRVSKHM